jgi:CRISPR system Cascade subunit CasE
MFLSRLKMNIRNKRVRHELEDVYELHRTLLGAFSEKPNGASSKVLFRVEDDPTTKNPQVLVQSEMEPDWGPMLLETHYLLDKPDVKRYDPMIRNGQILRFRLLANPTKKHDNKRLGILNEDEQVIWLDRKAKENGFCLAQVTTIPRGFSKGTRQGVKMTFYALQYEGVIKVTDADKFIVGLKNGIGSAKGFGFGLLSIAPYSE